ncbi:acyl-CoA thioesterase [Paramicrobacterium agarici]|uniref:Acyl-CoA thioesterase FadM n=1 Tax=Paramicrobacterium agarici TaxID=630514 RepID=A0A2A9DSV7_9MICO|nr:acyl-CoA thioesterase [Microbacterium agarici]PFG29451.1 acyl-CoA thioesterase FadM [Microbacterium agarici]
MHMILRTMLVLSRARRALRRRGPADPYAVSRLTLRVLPTDLDVLKHVNNGVYFSLFDLGRFDLLMRSGMWNTFTERGWYPVVASETITFRKSLTLWQRFTVETRILGFDDKSFYLEHRAVVDGEMYTQAFIRARFLKKSGGTVSVGELLDAIGHDNDRDLTVPEWLEQWGRNAALPSTREPAPSVWNS